MAFDLATGIINLVTEGLKIGKPFVDDTMAQKYEEEAKERSRKWLGIQADNDEIKRADAAYAYLLLLNADAQTPVRGNGAIVGVPSDILDALVGNTIQLIKAQECIANVSYKK